jgi:hypothetical protein
VKACLFLAVVAVAQAACLVSEEQPDGRVVSAEFAAESIDAPANPSAEEMYRRVCEHYLGALPSISDMTRTEIEVKRDGDKRCTNPTPTPDYGCLEGSLFHLRTKTTNWVAIRVEGVYGLIGQAGSGETCFFRMRPRPPARLDGEGLLGEPRLPGPRPVFGRWTWEPSDPCVNCHAGLDPYIQTSAVASAFPDVPRMLKREQATTRRYQVLRLADLTWRTGGHFLRPNRNQTCVGCHHLVLTGSQRETIIESSLGLLPARAGTAPAPWMPLDEESYTPVDISRIAAADRMANFGLRCPDRLDQCRGDAVEWIAIETCEAPARPPAVEISASGDRYTITWDVSALAADRHALDGLGFRIERLGVDVWRTVEQVRAGTLPRAQVRSERAIAAGDVQRSVICHKSGRRIAIGP